jgi:F-type H+-transporting ATPase subunit delta
LASRYGQDLSLQYKVDQAILGGLVVRVGDQVIDGSVASKLAALREQLV